MGENWISMILSFCCKRAKSIFKVESLIKLSLMSSLSTFTFSWDRPEQMCANPVAVILLFWRIKVLTKGDSMRMSTICLAPASFKLLLLRSRVFGWLFPRTFPRKPTSWMFLSVRVS